MIPRPMRDKSAEGNLALLLQLNSELRVTEQRFSASAFFELDDLWGPRSLDKSTIRGDGIPYVNPTK